MSQFLSGPIGTFIKYLGFVWAIVAGLIACLFFGGAVLLASWNETDANKNIEAMKNAETSAIQYKNTTPDPRNNGKLVYVAGSPQSKEVYTDKDFGISINSARVERKVQLYQWVEHETDSDKKKNNGDSAVEVKYWYHKEWCAEPVESNSFAISKDHENYGGLTVKTVDWKATDVHIGGFAMDPAITKKMEVLSKFNVTSSPTGNQSLTKIHSRIHSHRPPVTGMVVKSPDWTLHDGEFYSNTNPTQPEIGDQRVTFSYMNPVENYSIIAQQSGNGLVPYKADNGVKVCLVKHGVVDEQKMLSEETIGKQFQLWGLRFCVSLLIWFGLLALVSPLTTMMGMVPIIGEIGNFFLGLLMIPVAFVCTWGLVTLVNVVTIHPYVLFGFVALGVALYVIALRVAMTSRQNNAS